MRLTPFKGETPPEPGEDNPMGEDRLEFLLGEELGILVFFTHAQHSTTHTNPLDDRSHLTITRPAFVLAASSSTFAMQCA